MKTHQPEKTWSVSEAKGRLSEVLRCARQSGPQYIGKREQCVLISKKEWESHVEPIENMSLWLLKHRPETSLPLPKRGESSTRPNPFEES